LDELRVALSFPLVTVLSFLRPLEQFFPIFFHTLIAVTCPLSFPFLALSFRVFPFLAYTSSTHPQKILSSSAFLPNSHLTTCDSSGVPPHKGFLSRKSFHCLTPTPHRWRLLTCWSVKTNWRTPFLASLRQTVSLTLFSLADFSHAELFAVELSPLLSDSCVALSVSRLIRCWNLRIFSSSPLLNPSSTHYLMVGGPTSPLQSIWRFHFPS